MSLDKILALLIGSILSGAIDYVDSILESIIPICLHAETYMNSLTGKNWFTSAYNILFGFGLSLIVLKFLKKGFEVYVTWTDGDPDNDPLSLLVSFIKALFVAIAFPTMYGWLADVVTDLTDQLLAVIGAENDMSLAVFISSVSSNGLFTAIVALVFFIIFFLLYIQFLMRGLEVLILRIGIPIACAGLLDSDKGVFGPYIKKVFQSTLSVVVQLCLAKLSVGLMLNGHIFWGIAAVMLAYRTPKFLAEFVVPGGGGGGGISNKIYHTTRLFQIVKGVVKK